MNRFFKILCLLFLFSPAFAAEKVHLDKTIYNNAVLTFASHQSPGPFDTALAMKIQHEPVKQIRDQLSKSVNYTLLFFQGWDPKGEAHVTVITPPEYFDVLRPYISIDEIEKIALDLGIQDSDIQFAGIGRGTVKINDKMEETYFLVLQSDNLLKIRERIYQVYLQHGGPAQAWDPKHFYSHITIGYSLRDLHEQDGVLKDMAHSADGRFILVP